MVNPWVPLGTPEEHFWKRFFGKFVKGDLIELSGFSERTAGIYYSHYHTRKGEIKLFVFHSITRKGVLRVSITYIDPEIFRRIKVLRRAEEFTSLSNAVEYLRKNYTDEEIFY